MSKADLERLAADIRKVPQLAAALEGKVAFSDIVAVCQAHGYDISIDDLRGLAQAQSPDLSDEQLDTISAGAVMSAPAQLANPQLNRGIAVPLFGSGTVVPLVGKVIPITG